MRAVKILLLAIEIPMRVALVFLGCLLGWDGLVSFLSLQPEDSIGPASGGSAVMLILAGLAMSAALCPSPFWRNEALKSLAVFLVILFLVIAWFIGTTLLAGLVAVAVVGKDSALTGIIMLAAFIGCVLAQSFIFHGLKRLLLRIPWLRGSP